MDDSSKCQTLGVARQSRGFTLTNYSRCPGSPPAASTSSGYYSSEWTYGIDYPVAFGLCWNNGNFTTYFPSAILGKLPATTFLASDCNGAGNYFGLLYSPGTTWTGSGYASSFPLTVDTDGDGIPDTCHQCVGAYQYNGVAFRHNNGAVFLFADGHAGWVSKSDWLANKNNMWGDALPTSVR